MRFIIFLILNFGALALGAFLMGGSPAENEWYINLNKAPWTPPGWVFGFAWTIVMLSYSLNMTFSLNKTNEENRYKLIFLYALQLILNISWNPVFFLWHLPWLALIIITVLFVVIGYKIFLYQYTNLGNKLLLLPYFLWLSIAVSLNLYIVVSNN